MTGPAADGAGHPTPDAAARREARRRPRAAVFDAYGTLLDVHAAVGRHAARLGDKAAALSALWRTKQLEATWILSATGAYEDFWGITDRALGHAMQVHGVSDPALRDALLSAYRELGAYPDAAPTLRALRGAGLATAVLSNGSPEMLAAAVEAGGLGPLLDDVLSVHPLRRYKPDPRVYALATGRFRCQPHEVAFVSSNAWDAYGAARFGFRVFWANRSAGPVEYWLDELAEAVLPGLDAVPPLLLSSS
jgi:2-haloacid dehalogenase